MGLAIQSVRRGSLREKVMKRSVTKILASLSLLVLAACGTSSNNNLAAAPPGFGGMPCVGVGCTITGSGASVAPTFTTGDTVPWTPVSNTVLSEYLTYNVTNPTAYLVNIALNPTAGSSPTNFNGTLTIQFLDGTMVHNGTFSNGSGTESYRHYNQSVNGATASGVYRVYFEDPLGAIILTLTPKTGTDTGIKMSGNLYFKNFNSTAPNPLYQGAYDGTTYFPPGNVFCWMIDLGPYNCINNTVPPTSGAQPYILLGTIPDITIATALGI